MAPRGVLVVEQPTRRRPAGPLPPSARAARRSITHRESPSGLWAHVDDRQRLGGPITWQTSRQPWMPGRGPPAARAGSSSPRERLGGPAARERRSCARLERPRGRGRRRRRGSAGAHDEPRPAPARRAPAASGCRSAPTTSVLGRVPPPLTIASLLRGDVGDRRPQPSRVPRGSRSSAPATREFDHVRRVIPATEAGLDHTDFDLRGRPARHTRQAVSSSNCVTRSSEPRASRRPSAARPWPRARCTAWAKRVGARCRLSPIRTQPR